MASERNLSYVFGHIQEHSCGNTGPARKLTFWPCPALKLSLVTYSPTPTTPSPGAPRPGLHNSVLTVMALQYGCRSHGHLRP